MNNRWNKKEPKIIYKPRELNTFERMRIYAEIDKQYILEDIKRYAKDHELISARAMDLIDWDEMYKIHIDTAQMEYAEFDNIEYTIKLYFDHCKNENFDKDLYEVEIEKIYSTTVKIMARSKEEAESLIQEQYNKGTFFDELSECATVNFFVNRLTQN